MKKLMLLLAAVMLTMLTHQMTAADSTSIYGIHFYSAWNGVGAESLMSGMPGYSVETTWVQNKTDWTDLRTAVQNAAKGGFIPIVRLNWGPGYTVPNVNDWESRKAFVAQCKVAVQKLGDLCNIWIIGNEMNLAGEGGIAPDWYMKVFNGQDGVNCYDAIHGLQAKAVVLMGPVAPNNPNTDWPGGPYSHFYEKWKNYWWYLVNHAGTKVDGFAVHAYGGRENGQPGDTGYDPDARDDCNAPYDVTDPAIDVCWGFNPFMYFCNEVANKYGAKKPVYITETNTNQTTQPSDSYRAGWMQSAFEAMDTWNKTHANKIKTLCWFVYSGDIGWPFFSLQDEGHAIMGNCRQAHDDLLATTKAEHYVNTTSVPDAYIYQIDNGASDIGSKDPNKIVLGKYMGKREAWSGSDADFSKDNKLGSLQNCCVIQNRVFYAAKSGVYSFRTTSKDSSWLWVDGVMTVNNYGRHAKKSMIGSQKLAAGYHNITVKFVNTTGGAYMGFGYQPPTGKWQSIPNTPAPNGNALVYKINGKASDFKSPDCSRVVPGAYVGSFGWNGVAKKWGTGGPLGLKDNWIIMQSGLIWVARDADYSYRINADTNGWLWIDGQTVIANCGNNKTTWSNGSKHLTKGWHIVFIKFAKSTGSAYTCYQWLPPNRGGSTEIYDPLPIY